MILFQSLPVFERKGGCYARSRCGKEQDVACRAGFFAGACDFKALAGGAGRKKEAKNEKRTCFIVW